MEIKAPPLESLTCVRSTIFAGRYPRMTVTVSSGFIDKADCPYSGMFRGLISCWPGRPRRRQQGPDRGDEEGPLQKGQDRHLGPPSGGIRQRGPGRDQRSRRRSATGENRLGRQHHDRRGGRQGGTGEPGQGREPQRPLGPDCGNRFQRRRLRYPGTVRHRIQKIVATFGTVEIFRRSRPAASAGPRAPTAEMNRPFVLFHDPRRHWESRLQWYSGLINFAASKAPRVVGAIGNLAK